MQTVIQTSEVETPCLRTVPLGRKGEGYVKEVFHLLCHCCSSPPGALIPLHFWAELHRPSGKLLRKSDPLPSSVTFSWTQKCERSHSTGGAFGKNRGSGTALTNMMEAMPKPSPLLGEAEAVRTVRTVVAVEDLR